MSAYNKNVELSDAEYNLIVVGFQQYLLKIEQHDRLMAIRKEFRVRDQTLKAAIQRLTASNGHASLSMKQASGLVSVLNRHGILCNVNWLLYGTGSRED